MSLWHMAAASSGHWIMLTLSLLAVVFAAGTAALLVVLSLRGRPLPDYDRSPHAAGNEALVRVDANRGAVSGSRAREA